MREIVRPNEIRNRKLLLLFWFMLITLLAAYAPLFSDSGPTTDEIK